jgi:hypothetical protein
MLSVPVLCSRPMRAQMVRCTDMQRADIGYRTRRCWGSAITFRAMLAMAKQMVDHEISD